MELSLLPTHIDFSGKWKESVLVNQEIKLDKNQLLSIVTAIVLNGHPQRSPGESIKIAIEIIKKADKFYE